VAIVAEMIAVRRATEAGDSLSGLPASG
jgi:hypothetical protein